MQPSRQEQVTHGMDELRKASNLEAEGPELVTEPSIFCFGRL
jgi:hypothetical protein